jgi:hypothetical protein
VPRAAGAGGGRLQGEVHEVEAVPPEPVDLRQRVAGRVVHRADLHGSLPVDSIPSGYSTGGVGTMNCIAHLLKLIPHEEVPRDKVKLPKRSPDGAYEDQATLQGRTFVPEKY